MKSDFLIAVTQLAAERNLPREVVISAIEAALVSVYKKESVTGGQNLSVKILPNTGEVKVSALKTVVEDVEDTDLEVSQKEAEKYKEGATVGEVIEIETTPQFAGRIAAQTAKQVVMQRLKEAERELIYEEFSTREGDIVSAVVQRIEPRQVVLDVEKTEAVLLDSDMVPTERYRPGQRLKVLLLEVNRSPKGPQVLASRSDKNLVSRLFELEVPEVYNGTVEIRSVAREAGYRTKVAVSAKQQGIDPVGSCVGLRGIRIQNIVNELHGEKIDVVQWDKDSAILISNSLSPAQVARVEMNEEEHSAVVVVADRHLSLAIGKEGQNARLAAKLTGWRIDIKGATEAEEERVKAAALAAQAPPEAESETVEPVATEVAAIETPSIEEEVTVPVAAEVGTEESATVEEVSAEEPVPVEEAVPEKVVSEEEALPVQEEPVVVAAAEMPTTRSIEEIWPTAPEEIFKPPTELRFAEDLNIPLPGRSKSKSKKRKSKKTTAEAPGGTGAKGKKARAPAIPSFDDDAGSV